ncbi:MAG: alpha/beta fold hydrolase [Actinoplanes sp.]
MPLTEDEQHDIARANELGLLPVVFVHGQGLLPSDWDPWRTVFEEEAFATVAPGWPGDPEIASVTSHHLEAVRSLHRLPALVGHAAGGSVVLRLADLGVSRSTVAIGPFTDDPAKVRQPLLIIDSEGFDAPGLAVAQAALAFIRNHQ